MQSTPNPSLQTLQTQALDAAPQALLAQTPTGFVVLNNAINALFGTGNLKTGQIIHIQALVDCLQISDAEADLLQFLNKKNGFANEPLFTKLNNKKILCWRWLDSAPFVQIEDETIWQQQIEELKNLSDTDPLTQLANRRRFSQEFSRAVSQSLRNHTSGALILFDVDQLKAINDRWGHVIGDNLLAQFGLKAKSFIRPYECLARIGGDEFAIVTQHSGTEGASRLVEAMQLVFESILLPNQESLSASFGTAIFSQSLSETSDLKLEFQHNEIYKFADQELYLAKFKKRNLGRSSLDPT